MRRNDFFASVGTIIEKILENVNKKLKKLVIDISKR